MAYLLSIFKFVGQFDRWLFHKINGQWVNSFFDSIFLALRQPLLWAPLYLFLAVFVAINFRRNAGWWAVFFVCTVALTDMIGTNLFKHLVERARPCNDVDFTGSVRLLLKDCSPGYSFVSNHAANHFGMATYLFFTLRRYFPKWVWLAWIWAFAIGYSQIYVGIHYPTDVLGGALLGVLMGYGTALFFNKKFGFANFDIQPTVAP